MLFNLLIALLVVLVPVIWSTKGKGFGLFSAFLAAVCAVAAGGIAFALWEPTAVAITGLQSDGTSFLGRILQSNAMGLGLIVPYLISLVVLRLAVDSLVKANLDFSDGVNSLGGIAFGAVVGVISAGILATGASFLGLPPKVMGYAPVEEKSGNPVHTGGLWIPVDRLTVGLYEHLSGSAFASSTPLSRYQPQAHVAGAMQRMTYKGGAARNTALPSEFQVLGRYQASGPLSTLVTDSFLVDNTGKRTPQKVIYPDGTEPTDGATLEGYVIKFNSTAKDKGGNVILGNAQVRMIVELPDGTSTGIHPVACIAPPDVGAEGFYRFRYDAPEVFIASKGGASEATFAIEFILPKDAKPLSLIVKNSRIAIEGNDALKPIAYASSDARDTAINDRSLFTAFGAPIPGGGGGPVDTQGSVALGGDGRISEVVINAELPDGMTFNRTNRGPLEIDEEGRIVGGEHSMSKAMMSERGLDKKLRVEAFQGGLDVTIMQVELSANGARSLLGRSVETAEQIVPPFLLDDRGTRYEPVGYVYVEGEVVKLRYTPERPLRALSEAPALSRTKTDQSLWLIFRVTKGVTVKSFLLGNREVASLGEGILAR
jgi:hypothetical protein